MMTALSFGHKHVENFQTLNLPTVSTDSAECISPVIPLDIVDNPVQKQFLEPSVTQDNIFKQMKSEYNRLLSYRNKWPLHYITPESLAGAGLFYLQYEDKVQCPFCYLVISDWVDGDKPKREHMRKSPKCPFLMGCDLENIPLSEKTHHNSVKPASVKKSLSSSVSFKPIHPRMADTRRRILTYSGWPLNEPEPQQLAECGLFYSGVADVVTCFFCGGTLGNWEPDDDPWNEHAKFYPECSFLALTKYKRTLTSKVIQPSVKDIIKPDHPVQELFASNRISDIVEQALDIFPKDLVHEAVKRKNGNQFSLQEICDDILELKQIPKLHEQSALTVPQIQQETEVKSNSASASNVDLLLCKVCMDRERGVVFQPCGHFVSCWSCANLIDDCPVCRRPIIHKIKTYIS